MIQLFDKDNQTWQDPSIDVKIHSEYTAQYDPCEYNPYGDPQPGPGPLDLWADVPFVHPAYGYIRKSPLDSQGRIYIRVGMGDPDGQPGWVWPERNLTYVSIEVKLPFQGKAGNPFYLKCMFYDGHPGSHVIMWDPSSLKTGTMQQTFGIPDTRPGFIRFNPWGPQPQGAMESEMGPVEGGDEPCPPPTVHRTLSMNESGGGGIAPSGGLTIPDNVTMESCTWEEILDNGSSVPATETLATLVDYDPAGLDQQTGWVDFAYVDNTSILAAHPYQARMEFKGPAGIQDIGPSYLAWLRTRVENTTIGMMEVRVFVDEVIHNLSDTTVRCHTQPIVLVNSRSCWTMGYCGEGTAKRAVITLYAGDPEGTVDLEPWTGPVVFNLSGTVRLWDYVGDAVSIPISVELLVNGSVVRTETVAVDGMGRFTIPNVAGGTYDVRCRASHWLAAQVTGVTVQDDTEIPDIFDLVNGDVDGDNGIGFADFSVLQSHYGQSATPNTNGDLNGDGQVTFEDFAAMQNQYGRTGPTESSGGGGMNLMAGGGGENLMVVRGRTENALAMASVADPVPTPTAIPEPTPTPTVTPTPTPDPILPVLITLNSVKTDDTHFQIRADVPEGTYTLCCVAVSFPVTAGMTITSEISLPLDPEDNSTDAFALRRVLFGTTDEGRFAGGVEAVDNGTASYAEIFMYRRIKQLQWTDGVLEALRTPAAGGGWQTIDNATLQGTSVVVVEGTVPSGTPAPELSIGNDREPMVPGVIYTDITSGWTCGKTYRLEGSKKVAPANIMLGIEP